MFAVFDNRHTSYIKNVVSLCFKSIAGILIIINLITRDIIDSAVTGCMYLRFHKHLYGMSGNVKVGAAVVWPILHLWRKGRSLTLARAATFSRIQVAIRWSDQTHSAVDSVSIQSLQS